MNITWGMSHFACCTGRRDQLRFLKHLSQDKFLVGMKEQLTETQVGQAFYLLTGLPPFLKLRELRAGTLGGLTFGCSKLTESPMLCDWCDLVCSSVSVFAVGPLFWISLLVLESTCQGRRR